MRPWLEGALFGNPSGAHAVARRARAALEEARETLAGSLGVSPAGVIFTSGGTEADNQAVLGALAGGGGPVVVSAVEHPAVMKAALASGQELRVVPVDPFGVVTAEALASALDESVRLVSIQAANQETGVRQDLVRLARVVRRRAPLALLHCDAVQAAAWSDLADLAGTVDMISISSHKLGGPPGVGALVLTKRVRLAPLLWGGGQERELRSGTQNVAGAVGFGAAWAARRAAGTMEAARVEDLRDRLEELLVAGLPEAILSARGASRLPGHAHLRIPGVLSESLLVLLDRLGVCASAGSACASGAAEPSPVLLAMGVEREQARCALRLTLGPYTTVQEVELAAEVVTSQARCLLDRQRDRAWAGRR